MENVVGLLLCGQCDLFHRVFDVHGVIFVLSESVIRKKLEALTVGSLVHEGGEFVEIGRSVGTIEGMVGNEDISQDEGCVVSIDGPDELFEVFDLHF